MREGRKRYDALKLLRKYACCLLIENPTQEEKDQLTNYESLLDGTYRGDWTQKEKQEAVDHVKKIRKALKDAGEIW